MMQYIAYISKYYDIVTKCFGLVDMFANVIWKIAAFLVAALILKKEINVHQGLVVGLGYAGISTVWNYTHITLVAIAAMVWMVNIFKKWKEAEIAETI